MKRALVFLATITMLAFTASAAAALPVVNETDVVKNGTDTFLDVNPCTGEPATITTTFNAVFHITEFADGTVRVTGTTTGTFLADTIDASRPDFSGRFTSWFGFNGNTKNATGTSTFTVVGKGTDGSRLRFHETASFTLNANGEVTVEFDKVTCSSG
jgi:hypothetical protein